MGDIILETRDLTKHYGGVHALDRGGLPPARGEHVAIMGDNGAGKSTFVRQITGVEQPTRGEIIFEGQEAPLRRPRSTRGRRGSRRCSRTSRWPTTSTCPTTSSSGARRSSSTSGRSRSSTTGRCAPRRGAALQKTAVKIPNIRNTIRNMSGGQRQCVAIARTATFHSKLTIMDEPTAALGVQETAQVENIIRTLKSQGEPLILISHNMRQVFDLVDRIVVFRRGRIVANLRRTETDPQDVVSYITGAKTGAEYAGAA
jgi:fructose transport system ATP-binding protein